MMMMSASLPMTPLGGRITQRLVSLQMQRALLPQSKPTATSLCPGQLLCHASIVLCLIACYAPQPGADLLYAYLCVLHPFLVSVDVGLSMKSLPAKSRLASALTSGCIQSVSDQGDMLCCMTAVDPPCELCYAGTGSIRHLTAPPGDSLLVAVTPAHPLLHHR